jgi:hypothetical protein
MHLGQRQAEVIGVTMDDVELVGAAVRLGACASRTGSPEMPWTRRTPPCWPSTGKFWPTLDRWNVRGDGRHSGVLAGALCHLAPDRTDDVRRESALRFERHEPPRSRSKRLVATAPYHDPICQMCRHPIGAHFTSPAHCQRSHLSLHRIRRIRAIEMIDERRATSMTEDRAEGTRGGADQRDRLPAEDARTVRGHLEPGRCVAERGAPATKERSHSDRPLRANGCRAARGPHADVAMTNQPCNIIVLRGNS